MYVSLLNFVSVCTHENFSLSPREGQKHNKYFILRWEKEFQPVSIPTLWAKKYITILNVSHDTCIVIWFNCRFFTKPQIIERQRNGGESTMRSCFYLSRLSQQVKNRLGASDTECVFSYTKSTISIHSTSITLLFVIHKHYGKYKPQRSTHSLSCTQKVK